ncbi:hypothetical protein IAU60_005448 [Kwoniella sp. DSM 27419]
MSTTQTTRKTRCLGRSDAPATPCQACAAAGEPCRVVPHRRGRKPGTRLSEQVKARLKSKYAKGGSIHDSSVRGTSTIEAGRRGAPISSDGSLGTRALSAGLQILDNPGVKRPSTLAYTRPTSAVRFSETSQPDIGPSTQRTSSIAKLFTPKRPDAGAQKRAGLSLYREDPITCGYIDEATGKELFKFFMDKLSGRLFLFDISLHTYAKYEPRVPRTVHQKCLALAKDQMLRTIADDVKTEETVQALYVMTEYKEAEDENGYLLLGMVSRLCKAALTTFRRAVELDMAKPRSDFDARRNRNRSRIWLILYAADRRHNYCGQTAKPNMMPEDELVRQSGQWLQSPWCLVADHRLANNVILRRMLASHIDAIDRDNELDPGRFQLDVGGEYRLMEQEADSWAAAQTARDPETLIHARLSSLHAKVIRAFRAVEPGLDSRLEEQQDRERREALAVCINGSLSILNTMLQLPHDALRYACDSKHLYFAYASFFLYKVFDTKIAAMMLDRPALQHMQGLFQKCADLLEELTILPTHTIAFHAAFIRSLGGSCIELLTAAEPAPTAGQEATLYGTIVPEPRSSSSLPAPPNSQEPFTSAATDWDQLFNTDLSSLDLFPAVGDCLLDPSTEEGIGNSIDWNDWWPFDDVLFPQNIAGQTPSVIDSQGHSHEWQHSIHTYD